jgi:hypothetical protein
VKRGRDNLRRKEIKNVKMALKCRIVLGEVRAPNGSPSGLYTSLVNRFGESKAMELYALTETPEYNDALTLEVDKNGEMFQENFLRFVYMQDTPLEVRSEATDLFHKVPQEDLKKLQGLYVGGVFQPNQNNLRETGIFSEDEILEIVYSSEKRDKLKSLVETTEELPSVATVEDFRAEKSHYNGIGIKPLQNPLQVKEDIVRRLSGVRRSDIDDAIEALPYPDFIQQYKTDSGFKASFLKSLGNSFVVAIQHDPISTVEELMNVVDVTQLDGILETTIRITELDDIDLVIEEFEALTVDLNKAGIDMKFDEGLLYEGGHTIESMKEFTAALQRFVSYPSMESTITFASALDNFRDRPEDKVILDFNNPKVNPDTIRYFDTNKDEIQAFEQDSLIKHKEGVYQKIDNKYGLDQLYEYLYTQVLAAPDIVGLDNIPSSEGNLDILREELNKDVIKQDIEAYVMSKPRALPFAGTEVQQTVAIYKMFYGAPFDMVSTVEVVEPVDNEAYLKGPFMAEFKFYQIFANKEDAEFFDMFTVDHKGIRLVHDNQFSIDNVMVKVPMGLKKDLLNYSRLSKYLDLGQSSQGVESLEHDRLKAQQNPHTVPETKKDYQISEQGEIITEETKDFIRVRDRVYERALSHGDKSIYKELPTNGILFRQTNIQKPMTGKSPNYLKSFVATKANTVTYKANLTQKELAEINQKHFECE